MRQACGIGCVVALIGALAWWFRIGEGVSYDLPFAFADSARVTNVVVLAMDEPAFEALQQRYAQPWQVALHAKLLRRLKEDQSGPVIFDVLFAETNNPAEDADFAQAIAEHGQVVLAADLSASEQPGIVGTTARPPHPLFRTAAAAWGVSDVVLEPDGVMRRHPPETELHPSLSRAALSLVQSGIDGPNVEDWPDRWLRYYGRLEKLSYHAAFDRPAGFFKDKIVVIGGKPRTRYIADEVDEYRSPYTLWNGALISGVELHTTMLLNFLRGDWLKRLPPWLELALMVIVSLAVGFGLRLVNPGTGALIAAGIAVVIAGVGLSALHLGGWFPWAALAGIVVPSAWVSSLAAYKQQRFSPSESYTDKDFVPQPNANTEVTVPNYSLLKSIGVGASGEVWLAQNHVGIYHAVKIVSRSNLDARAYEREFRAIRRYMPISFKHSGLVRILFVGRNDRAGYFYYVLELGDDEVSGQEIDPKTYKARNFAKDLKQKGRLSVAECLATGIALCEPLEFLHKKGLVHRDIKPANIIFIDGIPKLADIGLLTEFSAKGPDISYVGTEGFMAPEGPREPSADIYSFGKVLYQALTGLDRHQFPTLPDWINEMHDVADFMALNSLVLKCCEENPRKRFQNAAELHKALVELERRLAKETA